MTTTPPADWVGTASNDNIRVLRETEQDRKDTEEVLNWSYWTIAKDYAHHVWRFFGLGAGGDYGEHGMGSDGSAARRDGHL